MIMEKKCSNNDIDNKILYLTMMKTNALPWCCYSQIKKSFDANDVLE